jgi:pimeloyl-ACP methyl ester carboxylesterase
MNEQTQAAAQGNTISANGIKVYYEESGTGTPLILLHGGTATHTSWAAQLPTYTQEFRVLALDSRAHGKTHNPSGELSYRTMSDDVAAFIDALKLDKPLVLGYSDGGQIALDLGMRYSYLVSGLVLGGTVYKFTESYYGFLRELGLPEPGKVDFDAMDADWIAYLKAEHPREDDPEYWRTLMGQIAHLWWTPLGYTVDDLRGINAPTLIFVGDRDMGVGVEQAVEMYRGIPNAELAIIPNADHGQAAEQIANASVMDFLRRHDPRVEQT